MAGRIRSGTRTLTLAEVQARAARAAAGFVRLGIGAGDSVATLLRNDVPFLDAMLGAGQIGAYSVPVNWHLKGEEAGYIIADSGAKALIGHSDLLPAVRAHIAPELPVLVVETPPEIRAAYGIDPARDASSADTAEWESWLDNHDPWAGPEAISPGSMIYTSGTTGRPKGVRRMPVSAAEFDAVYEEVGRVFGARDGMKALMTGPLYHSAPNAYARVVLMAGGSLTLMPRFDPEELLRLIEAEGITDFHAVPTMFVRLLRLPETVRNRYDVSSLHHVIHGAAPCPPEIKRQMIAWWGPVIHEYYGSTEAGLITAVDSHAWLEKPGTVGRPLAGTTIEILDDNGRALSPGETGEIYVGLQSIADFTYHNDDAKRRAIERDGKVTNGDIGYVDDDGFLYLCDRKIDMVISGGVNIYPAEIERVLFELDGVRDCAVFGIPDPEFGEALAAAVETDGSHTLTAQDVRDFLTERLARYQVPRVVTFHDALPREDSGKLFKRKLRDPYWRDAGRKI